MKRSLFPAAMLALMALVFSACGDMAASTAENIGDTLEATLNEVIDSSSQVEPSNEPPSAALAGDYGEYREIDAGENTRVVVFGSDEVSFQVISSLVIRNGNALLVDTKFSKTDAQEIIRFINDSDLNLTQIFISHGDPDYYFGLEEFRAAFPGARVSTTTNVAEHIEGTLAGKLEVWAEALGDEIPTNFVMPENLVDTSFEFEGLAIEIFGSDPARITLYIPELDMLLGGGNITGGNHLFLADMALEEDRARWLDNLTELQALSARTIIPGHTDLADELFDGKSINFSIEYLQTAAEVLPTVQSGEEFIAAMEERYPDLRSRDVLVLSGGVLTGEMEWRRYVDN